MSGRDFLNHDICEGSVSSTNEIDMLVLMVVSTEYQPMALVLADIDQLSKLTLNGSPLQ
jgi:hypothetical protein